LIFAPGPVKSPSGGSMARVPGSRRHLTPIARAAIETGFIIFLFYSNLMMGEFTRSAAARHLTIAGALADVFTPANFLIGVVSALIGYVVVEFLRRRI
jgi:hypothetical protein